MEAHCISREVRSLRALARLANSADGQELVSLLEGMLEVHKNELLSMENHEDFREAQGRGRECLELIETIRSAPQRIRDMEEADAMERVTGIPAMPTSVG